jgi:hypothetical protein
LKLGKDFRKVKTPKLSTIEEQCKDHNCLGEEITGTKATTPKNCLGLSLVKMVSIAWKLSMTEEQCKDQNSLFQQRDYRNKCHNPQKCPGFKSC